MKPLEMLAEHLPAAVVACASARVIKILIDDEPYLGHAALGEMWLEVAKRLVETDLKAAPKGAQIAAILLESYFRERGDWAKMEQSVKEVICKNRSLNPEVIDRVVESIESTVKSAIDTANAMRAAAKAAP